MSGISGNMVDMVGNTPMVKLNTITEAIEAIEKGAIPRNGYPIFDLDGKKIGEVTSGTLSPITKKAIGLAYIDIAYSSEGTEIQLGVRGRLKRAKISKLPFIPQ